MKEIDFLNRQMEGQRDMQREGIYMEGERQERLYAPQLREQLAESQAAVIAQTNPAKAIIGILKGFEGYILDISSNDYIKLGMPIINEDGLGKIASLMIPLLTDSMRFGNVDKKVSNALILDTLDAIDIELRLNWREYGIRDVTYVDIICNAIRAQICFTFSRSVEGDEKRFLSRILLESVSGTKMPEKKSGDSWLSKMFKL